MTRQQQIEPLPPKDELAQSLPSLKAFATSLCGDIDHGEDLAQETVLKALNHLNRFRTGSNMRAWLFTILRNTYLTQCRRAWREVRDEDGSISASVPIDPPQDAQMYFDDFKQALSLLKYEQREALLLVGAAGFSYEEAAVISGCRGGTVKSRVNRARTRLKSYLSDV